MYLHVYIVLQNYPSVNIELFCTAIISEDKFHEVLRDFKEEIKKRFRKVKKYSSLLKI